MSVEAPPPPAAARFKSLDALRGLCALLVAQYHFPIPGALTNEALFRHSYIFVDYFFVLSGFVIAFSYGDRIALRQISVRRFMGLRLGRIYPLHIAVIGAYLLLELGLYFGPGTFSSVTARGPFSGERTLPALASNILLLQSFGLHSQNTWNGPSWSIAAEVWTYLLFALVLLAPRRVFVWIVGALCLSSFAILWLNKDSIDATYDFGFIRCVYGFGLGFLTFRLFRKLGPVGSTLAEVVTLLAVLIFVSWAEGKWTFAAPIVFAVEVYYLASAQGFVSKILTYAPFQVLGTCSYSIYMIHSFCEARFVQVMHLIFPALTKWKDGTLAIDVQPVTADLLIAIMLCLLVALSYASYRIVEKPGRDLVRRMLDRSRPEPKIVPAQT